MASTTYTQKMFDNKKFKDMMIDQLPHLFQIAELESTRGGKIGMEVGVLRERIFISSLIYNCGKLNVNVNISSNEPEIDVIIFNEPISIKTVTSKKIAGFKLAWTVDTEKAKEFQDNYYPHCSIILIQINWCGVGKICYIPLSVQKELFDKIGKNEYIKLPKSGTNSRGIQITDNALLDLISNEHSKTIEILWNKTEINHNIYERWINCWKN